MKVFSIKNVFSTIMLCLLFCIVLIEAVNADNTTVNGVTYQYKIIENGVKITGADNVPEYLVIPDTLDGYQVTGIDNGFVCNETIKSVTIPGSVKSLYWAFLNCSKLETVVLENGIEKLDENSFQGCTSLSEINFPDSLKTIGELALFKCTSLIAVNLPQKLEAIGGSAFAQTGITAIDVPASVSSIGSNAFTACHELRNVTLHEGLKKIGERAFGECFSLKSIVIPDSVTDIGIKLFAYCSSLETVVFGDGLKTLPTNTFMGLPPFAKLTRIVLPRNLERIEESCFTDNYTIEYLYIPPSVNYIHEGNFYNYNAPTPGGEIPILQVVPDSYAQKWAEQYGVKYELALAAPVYNGSLKNFVKSSVYTGQYNDVPENSWYYNNVAAAYDLGLMTGSGDAFGVKDNVTAAAAITMAARIRDIYSGGAGEFNQSFGDNWYDIYVDYAIKNGIIYDKQFDNLTRNVTRAEFAQILACTLPDEALNIINTVEDGAIPDVPMSEEYAKAVYTLYRAGIFTGDGVSGSFRPIDTISRTEAATVVTRIADKTLRKSIALHSSSVTLSEKEFPDTAFRTYASRFDKNGDGHLSSEEVSKVTEMNISHMKIASLKGIEQFTALKELNCNFNNLTELNLEKNKYIEILYCGNNKLTSLNVSMLTQLEKLAAPFNNLNKLDITNNVKLKELTISGNPINTLDVTANDELEFLSCYHCGLTGLDLTHNIQLKTLAVATNAIPTIDLSKNVKLENLFFDNSLNTLAELDLTYNVNLGRLDLGCNYALRNVYAANCLKLWRVAIHAIDSDICHVYLNKKVKLEFISDTDPGVVIYVD